MRRFPLLLLLIALPAVASAQEPSPDPASVEPFRGSAAPTPKPQDDDLTVSTTVRAPVSAFETDRAANRVDDETIARRQAKSIADALEEEQGIFIQHTNRGAGTLIIRGSIGPENLLYFDGVRFSQNTFRTGPSQYLNTLDPWALGSIEVLRGPGSVLYGSGAVGGVVQLFPHAFESEDGTHVKLRFAGETADLGAGGAVDASARYDRFVVNMGGSFRGHNDLRVGQNGGESIVIANDDDGVLAGSDYRELFFRGGIGYDLTPRNTLTLNYNGGVVMDAPRTDRIGAGEYRRTNNRDDLVYATYTFSDSGVWDHVKLNMSWHRTNEVVDRRNCFTDEIDGDDVAPDPVGCARDVSDLEEKRRQTQDIVQTLGSSLAVANSILDWRLRLNWGADLYGDAVTESSRKDASEPDFEWNPSPRGNFVTDSTFGTFGFFARAEQSPLLIGDHEIALSLGGRLDTFSAHAPDVSPEIGDVDYTFTGIVGSASLAYLYADLSNVYISWNQGFRAPNLQETTVLGDTGNFFEVPNPDLDPERSDTFELGQKLNIDGIVKTDLALFVTLFADRITREDTRFEGESEIDGKPVVHRVNRDSAYNYGAEFGASSYPIYSTAVYGNITYIDGAVETPDGDPEFEEGPLHSMLGDASKSYENPRRMPPVQWIAGVRWEQFGAYADFWAAGNGAQSKLAPGDRSDLRICESSPGVLYDDDCPGSESWYTLNLRGGYGWERFRVDLALENLTDQRYRPHGSGVVSSGFNAMLSVGYRE